MLDFAVQAVHVSNQALLTAAHPHRTSSAIGGYMLFYSLGSALGATATTTVYSTSGWHGSATLGATFALGALLVWALGTTLHAARRGVEYFGAGHDAGRADPTRADNGAGVRSSSHH